LGYLQPPRLLRSLVRHRRESSSPSRGRYRSRPLRRSEAVNVHHPGTVSAGARPPSQRARSLSRRTACMTSKHRGPQFHNGNHEPRPRAPERPGQLQSTRLPHCHMPDDFEITHNRVAQ
jgi:hypothetical protein